MATFGLYWWGYGRMPMEKMEVITEEMAKRFFAEVEKRTGKSIRRTRDALEWVEIRLRMARAFSNDTMTDTTDIYATGVEWLFPFSLAIRKVRLRMRFVMMI